MKREEKLNALKEEAGTLLMRYDPQESKNMRKSIATSKTRVELSDDLLADISGGGSRKTIMGAKKKMCPCCNKTYAGSETHCNVPTCNSAQLVTYEE